MKNEPVVSVVVPVHAEEHWAIRAIRSVFTSIEPPPYELVVVIDKAAQNSTDAICAAFAEAPEGVVCQPITIDAGSLGAARNAGVKAARGKYVTFLDADDLFSAKFLRQAFEAAEKLTPGGKFVIHHEWSVMFGVENFVHRHFSSTDPCFDARDVVQFNPWSALLFGPKTLFERYPYTTRDTFEDWDINSRMLGDDVLFLCVPDSCKFVRMKLDQTSLAARLTTKRAWLARMPLFDRRDTSTPDREPFFAPPSPEIMQQALYAHHQNGEFRLTLATQPQIRVYPRQVIWDDQAFLRDAIGDADHVVLVNELKPGGAEKYAIDWARALKEAGEKVVLVETAPMESPWLEKAKDLDVVRWVRRRQLNDQEQAAALQRGLIQSDLQSLMVCNSNLGWALVQDNPEPLARRVIAASFSTYMVRGFSHCPPFYMRSAPKNLTIITDNERHAKRMKNYGVPAPVKVIPPKCTYQGRSMRRQISDSQKIRILWAGRGSPEKKPETAALVAKAMPEVDMHIWGDVPQMAHALDNLKYRGPFESFDKIEGTYDAYLLTSETEGMPNTALEAVAAGLPVISTDVGDVSKIATRIFSAPVAKEAPRHVENACRAIDAWSKYSQDERNTARETVAKWAADFGPSVLAMVKE